MNRNALFTLLILLINSNLQVFSQKKNRSTTYTTQQIQEDMTVLKAKVEKYHAEPFAYISKENYEHLVDSLYHAVKPSMNYQEVFQQLAPLVIALQDGHTSISHNKKFLGKTPKLIPFYIRKLGNEKPRYFIAYNCSKDSTLKRGTEIFSINEMSITAIFEKIKTVISADNYNDLSRNFYIQGDFPSYYLKYFGIRDSLSISYRLANDTKIYQTKIACLTGKEIGKTLKSRYKWAFRNNLEVKIIDSLTKTAKLDITSFLMAGKFDWNNRKFKKILKADFKKIKDKNIENLIIDMRGNGGGYIPNVARLLKYILPKPFTLIDSLAFKKKAYFKVAPISSILPPLFLWAGFMKRKANAMYRVNKKDDNQKPATALHFNGKIYFLINAGCYSATTFTLALAKDKAVGTFIGEPVGGASWGSHAVQWYDFKLPNSKITVHSPLMKITHKLHKTPNNFFLQPDFYVGRNYEELLKNNDNVLDFTLGLIRGNYLH